MFYFCFVYAKLLDICFVHVMFLFLFILISNFEFEIKHALFFFWFTKFYKLGCICVHYNPNLKTYAQQKKNHFHLSATKISFFLLTWFLVFFYHVILLLIQTFNDNFIMSFTTFTKVTIDFFLYNTFLLHQTIDITTMFQMFIKESQN